MDDDKTNDEGVVDAGTPPGPDDEQEPEDERDKDLSRRDKRIIRELEKQIRAHKEKLEAYKKNPDSFDNNGYLKMHLVKKSGNVLLMAVLIIWSMK
ncbi:TPA: hypothetical protein R5S02_004643 [Salmonella enterica]|nr:hypothetical protein [Salmonella enterica]